MNIFHFPFNIEVQEIKKEIEADPQLWDFDRSRQQTFYEQKATENILLRHSRKRRGQRLRDTEDVYDTVLQPWFPKTMDFMNWFLEKYGGECGRIAIVKLPPDEVVALHIDEGGYYRARDRFHLVIQGMYEYEVDGERQIFRTGDLFWFDSQKNHRAENIGEQDRIVLIFDVKNSMFREIERDYC